MAEDTMSDTTTNLQGANAIASEIPPNLPAIVLAPMPIDSHFPPEYDPWGPMGWIVHGSGFVNGLYFSTGAFSLMRSFGHVDCPHVLFAALAGVLYFGTSEWTYRLNAQRAKWV
jgi:hypothetical protein